MVLDSSDFATKEAPPNWQQDGAIDYSHSKYRDKFWAILFLLHLAGMITLFVVYRDNLEEIRHPKTSDVAKNDWILIIVIIAAGALTSAIWAILWIALMKRFTSFIIKGTFVFVIILQIIGTIALLMFGGVFAAIMGVISLVLFLVYMWFAWKRIPFATVMLKMATQCIKDHSAPVLVGLFMAVLSNIWAIFWLLTVQVLGVGVHNPTFAIFMLLISLYWTSEVLTNIVHVTAAGVSATWYFAPATAHPTSGAFKRAMTTSFGSICFGSLLIAIVQAVRAVLRMARDNENEIIMCLVQCILNCLERILEYLNLFAFAQVAIYGVDFWTAAKNTWQLFKAKGFEGIVNDDLTGFVLVFGALGGGVLSAVVGGLWAHYSKKIESVIIVAIVCFLIGYVITQIIMGVIRSYVTTFFVCFAEDPQTLTQTHPQVYTDVVNAIREMHGQSHDSHFQGGRV